MTSESVFVSRADWLTDCNRDRSETPYTTIKCDKIFFRKEIQSMFFFRSIVDRIIKKQSKKTKFRSVFHGLLYITIGCIYCRPLQTSLLDELFSLPFGTRKKNMEWTTARRGADDNNNGRLNQKQKKKRKNATLLATLGCVEHREKTTQRRSEHWTSKLQD